MPFGTAYGMADEASCLWLNMSFVSELWSPQEHLVAFLAKLYNKSVDALICGSLPP